MVTNQWAVDAIQFMECVLGLSSVTVVSKRPKSWLVHALSPSGIQRVFRITDAGVYLHQPK